MTAIFDQPDSDISFPVVGQTLKHGTFSWKVERHIYSGPFSDVFAIVDTTKKSRKYAMKVERVNASERPVLKLDGLVLNEMKGVKGFPDIVTAGRSDSFKYCVMQLLGPDLGKLRKSMNRGRFSQETAYNIALQTISLLQKFHDQGWLCRDVKATNFAVGLNADSSTVYMLDFGFARRFLNKDKEFRPQRPSAPILGTMPYASLAALSRKEQCPRDDIESWYYMVLEFILGCLPWTNLSKEMIIEYKQHIRKEGRRDFFEQLPSQFNTMLSVIDDTGFYNRPDYEQLRFLIESAAVEGQLDLNAPLDWIACPNVYTRAQEFGTDGSVSSNSRFEVEVEE